VNLNRTITVDVNNKTVAEVLSRIFDNTDIMYVLEGENIILMKKTAENMAQQQSGKTITGTVLDQKGEPVIGAGISVKGTRNGTASDVNGNFKLNVAPDAILTVSYIGYISQEVTVGNRSDLRIIMEESATLLDDVVVVGYGTQKKLTLIGAVSSIVNDDIVTTKTTNIQNALSGKIAGLKIGQKTSEPGTFNNTFSIRGMGSPLIIIDGVPRDNMVRMDAGEIESVSILKDASAAIYGVRAANGVVLITTKKGERNTKFKMDYTGYYGIQHLLRPGQPMDAIGYMQLQNEKTFNSGGTIISYPKESFEPYLNGTSQTTDWMQEMRDMAPSTYHNLSVTGGTDKLDYFVSFGHNYEGGYWKSDDLNYKRFNVRSNVTANITHGLKAEMMLNLITDSKYQPSLTTTDEIMAGMWQQIPINPYYANNNPEYPYTGSNGFHPEMQTYAGKSGYQQKNTRIVNTNMALEWEIPYVKGLKARGMYSYDYTENENKISNKSFHLYSYNATTDKYNIFEAQAPSYVRREWTGRTNTLMQLSLSYAGKFLNNNNVSVLALYEESDREADNFWGRRDLSMDAIDQLFAGNSANQQTNMNTGNLYHLANKSFVGRVNYDYASKYLAEFSFRYDGSSKFAPGHQWGFFPSGFLGWRISEEKFISENEKLQFITNLKLRASYGLMGDDSASSYQFLTGYTYPSGGYYFNTGFINALASLGMANKNITWYNANTVNIGLDADLWNGLLGFSLEVFKRDRSGLLATRSGSLPGLVGANLPQENLNSDQTRGGEITLTHRHRFEDFKYNFSGHVAFSRSKTKYSERAKANHSYDNWRNNPNDRWNNIWWGYNYLGQYQSYEEIWNSGLIYSSSQSNSLMLPGDLIYEDWNGDGYIDSNDYHPIAINNADNPLLTYGFSIGAEYKHFDLNLSFQGTGMRWMRYGSFYTEQLLWDRNNLDIFLDRWHRSDQFDPNSSWVPGTYPSTWAGYGNERINFIKNPDSKFWILDDSYLRLKAVELGYTIPLKLAHKIGLQKARLFFNGYNLFTFSAVKFVDPEYPSSGDGGVGSCYPMSQTYNFGINVSF
jgi:TonB-linked SusC/RagA family outer membrane protein